MDERAARKVKKKKPLTDLGIDDETLNMLLKFDIMPCKQVKNLKKSTLFIDFSKRKSTKKASRDSDITFKPTKKRKYADFVAESELANVVLTKGEPVKFKKRKLPEVDNQILGPFNNLTFNTNNTAPPKNPATKND